MWSGYSLKFWSVSRREELTSKYIFQLKNNLFFKNIAVVTGGNIAAKLVGILSAPIITRLFSPEDYGIFSTLLAISGIAGAIATLRYAIAIPLAKDEKLAENLLRLSFLITLFLNLPWIVLIFLFGESLTVLFSITEITPFLWVLPIIFFSQGLYLSLTNWAIREKKFGLITQTKITQSVSSSGIKIGLGLLSIKPLGLFIGHIVQEFAGTGRLLSTLLKSKPDFFKYFSWTEIKFAASRYKDFPLIQSWSQLLLGLGAQLPVILIGSLYGVEVVGVFGLAQNMISIPMNLLGQSVGQVFYAEISKYGIDNKLKIYKLALSIIFKMFWLSIVPLSLVIAFGPRIFNLVFGSEWIDAGVYARFLSMTMLVRFISNPIMSALNVLEKQGIQLFLNSVKVLIVFFIFTTSYLLAFTAVEAIIFYGVIFPIYSLIELFVTLRILKKT